MTPLVELFLRRCQSYHTSIWEAMEEQVDRLRHEVGGTARGTLEKYFHARNVRRCDVTLNLEADGATRPLGSSFSDGFVMEVRAGLPGARHRFTEAHELCHTFFYELVPEVKFRPHDRDPLEERLCNHGAAALLVPRDGLANLVAKRPVSLETLEDLSRVYGVAQETMFMRLRHLGLWHRHLSIWHRCTSGRYMSLQAYGWTKGEWNWVDEDALDLAWEQSATVTGRTFVYREDSHGHSFALPLHYEARRNGKVVTVLSGDGPMGEPEATLSLWSKQNRGAAIRGEKGLTGRALKARRRREMAGAEIRKVADW